MSLQLPSSRADQTVWFSQQTPLLKDSSYRRQAVQSLAGEWETVRQLWRSLAASQHDDEVELVDPLARWSRNCCVEPDGGEALLPIAGSLKTLLWRYSSFLSLSDPFRQPVLQALVQFLSNLAATPERADVLLPPVIQDDFDKNVVIRLLASDDAATLLGATTFLYVALDNAPQQSALFLTKSGLSIVEALLRKMEGWFEAAEGGPEERCFEVGYEILKLLFEAGHTSEIYLSLVDGIAGSPISLPQSLLLKLFDAFLHSSGSASPAVLAPASLAFLLPTADRLLAELLRPMRALRAGGDAKTPFEDQSFAKCNEGFALALKAVIWVALLGANDNGEAWSRAAGARMVEQLGEGAYLQVVLELLDLSDVYEPRLVRSPSAPPTVERDESVHAFAPVRKDVARLLGIVAASSRAAQDRLAELGALEVLLGMCALDVQNPFLREHALFAVRSLLLHNPANQARVKELEPQATIGEDGQLGDVPDRWRN